MTLFDFFQAEELPVPAITADQAREIASAHFGVDAEITPLGSQQDANFLLTGAGGEPVGVLKIANPAFSRIELEAQDAAAAYISQTEPGVRAATNIELPGHPPIAEFRAEDGTVLYGRIIAYLSGGTMSGDRYVTPTQAAALGTLAGRTCRALADFEHPGVDRILQWDLRYAQRTVELLSGHMTDTARREAVEAATATAWNVLADLGDDLPVQVIHGDITDDNVVCGTLADGRLPDGIIDLGDLTRSWTVAELAIAVSSLLRHEGGEPAATLPAIAAFNAVRPLSPAEIEALWPLVVLRAAVLVVSGIHQASIDADNEYATGALDFEWRIFERAIEVPNEVMTALIRDRLGIAHPPAPVSPEALLIDGLDAGSVVRLDLSVDSDAVDAGAWLNPAFEADLAAAELARGAGAVITTFGQPRVSRSAPLSPESPATVGTGLDLWPGAPLTLTSPWAGVVESATGDTVVVTGTSGSVRVSGALSVDPALRTGQSVAAGAALGVVDGHVWIQCLTHADVVVPDLVRPEYSPGWLHPVSDPAPLLGLESLVGSAGDSEALWQRRADSFATVQEHYCAGALLPQPAADRARLARAHAGHRRPQLSGHGEQRGDPGPRSPGAG